MYTRVFMGALTAMIIVVLGGCVSSKEYRARLSDIDDLKYTIGQKEAEVAALKGEVEGLKKERDSLAEAIRKLEAQNADLKFTMAASELDMTKEMGRLKSELAAREAELDKAGEEIKAHEMRLAEMGSRVGQLEAERQRAIEERDEALDEMKATYDDLVSGLKGEIDKGRVEVTRLKDRLSVSMVEKVLFDSGSAQIKADGKKVLDSVAEVLKRTTGKHIRVEGHTDDVPIGPRIIHIFPTNWELSTTRATNVVRYLQDVGGVDPAHLSAAGYSEYAPVASNETSEGKARNRRIEISLIPMAPVAPPEATEGAGAQ